MDQSLILEVERVKSEHGDILCHCTVFVALSSALLPFLLRVMKHIAI